MTDSMTLNDWESITTTLSSGQRNYNELHSHYATLASNAALLFSADYDQQFTQLEQVAKNASLLAVPHIFAAVDDAIRTLVKHRIFDIDREHFAATYYKQYDIWSAAHEAIAEIYAGIVTNAAEMDAYRIARVQGSGQVIGGGLSVEGAAKGIVIAGAANLAISAAHSLFDLISKGASAAADAKKMNDIFRAPETKGRLVAALEESLLNVHLALLDALDTAKVAGSDFQRVTVAEQQKARRMLTNSMRGQVPTADQENILLQVLTLNPYYLEAYIYALDSLGDANGNIERVATYFHLDLTQQKRDRISVLCVGTTEETILDAIRNVGEAGQHLGIFIESEFLAPLHERLRILDINARTVEGRLYPTRDQARTEEVQIREARERDKADKAKSEIRTVDIDDVVRELRQIGKYLAFICLGIATLSGLGLILGKFSAGDRDRSTMQQPATPANDELSVEFSGKSTIEVRDATRAVVYAGEYSEPHSALIKGKLPFEISVGTASNVHFSRLMPGQDQGFPIDLLPDGEGHVAAQKVE
jgi:hypothetical protein